MKHALSLLLAFLLVQTQAWALSGGPDFGSSNSGVTLGTFAGVLVPTSSSATSTTLTSTDAANSLGIFSLGVPQLGLASGVFVYFSAGATYTGTILGEADPETLELRALVKAQFNITFALGVINTTTGATSQALATTPGGYASGSLKAEISPGQTNRFNGLASVIRISGSANLEVQSANVNTGQPVGAITSLVLALDGYKQSNTTAQSVDISAITNTNTSTSSTGSTTSSTGG